MRTQLTYLCSTKTHQKNTSRVSPPHASSNASPPTSLTDQSASGCTVLRCMAHMMLAIVCVCRDLELGKGQQPASDRHEMHLAQDVLPDLIHHACEKDDGH